MLTCFFCRDTKGSRILKPSISKEFSAKAFYLTLEGNPTYLIPSTHVWLGLVPPRVEVFCWPVVTSKVVTVDNLRKKGVTYTNILDTCTMCGKENETINHLFLHCEVAVQVWNDFIRRCGIAWCCPKNIAEAANAWRGGCFIGCGHFFMENDSFCYFMVDLEGKK